MLVHVLPRNPRVLVLEEEGKALVLASLAQDSHLPFNMPDPKPTVLTEFVDAVRYTPLIDAKLSGKPEVESQALGCIGILHIQARTWVMVVTQAEFVGLKYPTMQGFGCEDAWRVKSIGFFCLESDEFDHRPTRQRDHPCHGVHKFLTSGNFYYSGTKGFDITSRLDVRLHRKKETQPTWFHFRPRDNLADAGDESSDVDLSCDPRFLFNTFALSALLDLRQTIVGEDRDIFGRFGFALQLVEGYYGVQEMELAGETVALSVRSRLGWRDAGTRFNRRGIVKGDPYGSVANFAETETILRTGDTCFSFVQVRGSVPLVWSERGSLKGANITIKYPVMLYSLDPFRRHFYTLFDEYRKIHCLSLLCNTLRTDQDHKPEVPLADCYRNVATEARKREREFRDCLGFEEFDEATARVTKGYAALPSLVDALVGGVLRDFGATVVKVDHYGQEAMELLEEQKGAFRVNCRDCLDRTNLVQSLVSGLALDSHLGKLGLPSLARAKGLQKGHRELFYENGNAISQSYAGSNSMDNVFTRTGVHSAEDLLSNVREKEIRTLNYLEPGRDAAKQAAINQFLGISTPRVRCLTKRDFGDDEGVQTDEDEEG